MFCIGGKVKNSVRAYGLRLLQTVTLRAITFAVAPFAGTCIRTREHALRADHLTLPTPVPRGKPVSILSLLVFVTSEKTPETTLTHPPLCERTNRILFPKNAPTLSFLPSFLPH